MMRVFAPKIATTPRLPKNIDALSQGEGFRSGGFAPCEVERGKKIRAAFDERDRRECLSFAQADRPPADAAGQRPCLAVFLPPMVLPSMPAALVRSCGGCR